MTTKIAYNRKLIGKYELKLEELNTAYEESFDDVNDLIEVGRKAYLIKQDRAIKYSDALSRHSIYKCNVDSIPEELLIRYAKRYLLDQRKSLKVRIDNYQGKLDAVRDRLQSLETGHSEEQAPPSISRCPTCGCTCRVEQQASSE